MEHSYFREKQGVGAETERLVSLLVKDLGSSFFSSGEKLVVSHCHDVSPVKQKGPMCGLVGLTMAAQLLMKASSPCHTSSKTHPERILEYAVQNGLSRHGEMFSTSAMEQIIENHLLLKAQVVMVQSHNYSALRDLIVQVVSGQKAVLVPYDADKDHRPCLARGHSAHWCLLVGVCVVMKSDENWASSALEYCEETSPANTHYHVIRET